MEELYTEDKKGILRRDSKIPKFQILTLGTCQIVPFWNDLTCPQCSKMKQKGQTYCDDLICIWYKRKGEKIIFELECSGISIQYLKSIHQPRPVANAILDGDVAHPIRLDANFDETWGDCLYLQTILHGGEKKTHTLEIEIVQDSPEQAGEFYLVSIITD